MLGKGEFMALKTYISKQKAIEFRVYAHLDSWFLEVVADRLDGLEVWLWLRKASTIQSNIE